MKITTRKLITTNTVQSVSSVTSVIQTSVYKARTMNALLQPGMQYYDDILCSAALPPSKGGTNPYLEEENGLNSGFGKNIVLNTLNPIEIYPNPNYPNGELTIAHSLATNTDANLYIYDMVGRVVQQVSFTVKNHILKFQLSNQLTNGTYKIVLKQGDEIKASSKLTIIN